MKILIVSQYFYPENFRINDLAKELKNRGNDVDVLTGKPNYPIGEYYEGYSFAGDEDETWEEINIYRVPLRARYSGAVNLVRNYLSFLYQANKRITKLDKSYDLIYVFEVSPITVALPAIKLKKNKKIPIIMNVQDLWPENIIAITGIDNLLTNYMIGKLVNYIYKRVDLILASSPAFLDNIKKRVNNKKKVIYWPQYSLVEINQNNKPGLINFDKEKMNVVFTGNIGEAQGLDIVIEASNQIKDKDVVFHIIGNGRKKVELEESVKKLHLEEQIKFYGQINEKEIPGILKKASFALLILRPNTVFDMTVPAKLQTYIACGCPVIACVGGVSKEMVDDGEFGLTTVDISVEGLIRTIEKAKITTIEEREIMSKNALKYSKKYFDKEMLLNKLNDYMEDLCQNLVEKH